MIEILRFFKLFDGALRRVFLSELPSHPPVVCLAGTAIYQNGLLDKSNTYVWPPVLNGILEPMSSRSNVQL